LRITDVEGNPLYYPINNQSMQTGVQEINLDAQVQVRPGFYYLQLLKDLQIVHFQEYEPR
jgi:hypothetical protein